MTTFPSPAFERARPRERGNITIAAIAAIALVTALAATWARRVSLLEDEIRMASRAGVSSSVMTAHFNENVDCIETVAAQLWYQNPVGDYPYLLLRKPLSAYTGNNVSHSGGIPAVVAGVDGYDVTVNGKTTRTRARLLSRVNDGGIWRFNYQIETKNSETWTEAGTFSCPKPCTSPVAGVRCVGP